MGNRLLADGVTGALQINHKTKLRIFKQINNFDPIPREPYQPTLYIIYVSVAIHVIRGLGKLFYL